MINNDLTSLYEVQQKSHLYPRKLVNKYTRNLDLVYYHEQGVALGAHFSAS